MLNHQVNFSRWQATDLEPEGYRPAVVSYQSNVIELVKKSCERLTAPSILQVGGISTGLMEIVANAKGKLVVCDPKTEDGLSLLYFLPQSSQKFDTIFLWDNLLAEGVENQKELLLLIDNCSKMGTSLVMFTTTRHSIPSTASKFVLGPNSSIDIIPTTLQTINAEFFDTAKKLPVWRCMRATQLRNGFREHLLVRRS